MPRPLFMVSLVSLLLTSFIFFFYYFFFLSFLLLLLLSTTEKSCWKTNRCGPRWEWIPRGRCSSGGGWDRLHCEPLISKLLECNVVLFIVIVVAPADHRWRWEILETAGPGCVLHDHSPCRWSERSGGNSHADHWKPFREVQPLPLIRIGEQSLGGFHPVWPEHFGIFGLGGPDSSGLSDSVSGHIWEQNVWPTD